MSCQIFLSFILVWFYVSCQGASFDNSQLSFHQVPIEEMPLVVSHGEFKTEFLFKNNCFLCWELVCAKNPNIISKQVWTALLAISRQEKRDLPTGQIQDKDDFDLNSGARKVVGV